MHNLYTNFPNVSTLLFLISKLLQSSNEPTLLLLFDAMSTDLATEILRQNDKQVQIVYANYYYIRDESIFYDNSIIISIHSRPIAIVAFDFLRLYYNNRLNQNSKHLCIFTQPNNQTSPKELDFLLQHFKIYNFQFVPVHLTDNDFVIHTFTLPSFASSDKLLRILYPNDILNNTVMNVRDLIFSTASRNFPVTYHSVNFNPPYLYRVQDWKVKSCLPQIYIDGIEVRMVELLMDQFGWPAQFEVFNTSSAYLNEERYTDKIYQQFINRIFRSNVRTKGLHTFRLPSTQQNSNLY